MGQTHIVDITNDGLLDIIVANVPNLGTDTTARTLEYWKKCLPYYPPDSILIVFKQPYVPCLSICSDKQ